MKEEGRKKNHSDQSSSVVPLSGTEDGEVRAAAKTK
jgi:hypothetical protein